MRLAALALLSLVAACATPTTQAHREEIVALEQVWHGGADADRIAEILAPDFHRPMPNGEIWDRERQLGWLRGRPPAPSGFTTRFEGVAINVDGDTATATGIANLVNAAGAVVDRNQFTDVYKLRDGEWRMVSAQRTQIINER